MIPTWSSRNKKTNLIYFKSLPGRIEETISLLAIRSKPVAGERGFLAHKVELYSKDETVGKNE
jgi:hypothetical protein